MECTDRGPTLLHIHEGVLFLFYSFSDCQVSVVCLSVCLLYLI